MRPVPYTALKQRADDLYGNTRVIDFEWHAEVARLLDDALRTVDELERRLAEHES